MSLVSGIHFFNFSLSLTTRFLKYFLSGEAKVLEGCSVFGVQNPLSPGLMAAKGGKCLHPSFALPPLFYFFIFHFLFQLFL